MTFTETQNYANLHIKNSMPNVLQTVYWQKSGQFKILSLLFSLIYLTAAQISRFGVQVTGQLVGVGEGAAGEGEEEGGLTTPRPSLPPPEGRPVVVLPHHPAAFKLQLILKDNN